MQTIFIIGAGSGLGNGVAEEFARHGFKIVLMSRNAKHLAAYAAQFAAKGFALETYVLDVSDFAATATALRTAQDLYGIPDVLFYNVANTTKDDPIKRSAQMLMDHYATDVAGAYNCIQCIATQEFSAKKGAILITGGGLALKPYLDYLPLSLDKAALRAMVQALAPHLEQQGIYLGTVQITGAIGSNEHFAASTIARIFWQLYQQRNCNEIIY